MYKSLIAKIIIFIVGMIIGAWLWSQPIPYEPTPEECLSVCVEQFERYGC